MEQDAAGIIQPHNPADILYLEGMRQPRIPHIAPGGVSQLALLKMETSRVAIILAFSLVGIAGSYGVAWFGIRVNTFANSRCAFAALKGKPYPCYSIPLQAGMSIGMLLVSVELLIMLFILLYVPGDLAGSCFIGFARIKTQQNNIGIFSGDFIERIMTIAAKQAALGHHPHWIF